MSIVNDLQKIVIRTNLEVSALVEGVRRSEESDLPFEEVVIVDQFGADALQGVLLKAFELEGEGSDRATRHSRRRGHLVD